MYRFLIVFLFMNICFSKFAIGVDFASTINGSGNKEELDIGFSLSYDHKINTKLGFGIEYLLPAETENTPESNISMLSIYGMYDFIDNSNVTISGKIGYSIPEINFDFKELNNLTGYPFDFKVDDSGGLMLGVKAAFGPMNIMYSFHKAKLRYTDMKFNGIPMLDYNSNSQSYNLNRITASYYF